MAPVKGMSLPCSPVIRSEKGGHWQGGRREVGQGCQEREPSRTRIDLDTLTHRAPPVCDLPQVGEGLSRHTFQDRTNCMVHVAITYS